MKRPSTSRLFSFTWCNSRPGKSSSSAMISRDNCAKYGTFHGEHFTTGICRVIYLENEAYYLHSHHRFSPGHTPVPTKAVKQPLGLNTSKQQESRTRVDCRLGENSIFLFINILIALSIIHTNEVRIDYIGILVWNRGRTVTDRRDSYNLCIHCVITKSYCHSLMYYVGRRGMPSHCPWAWTLIVSLSFRSIFQYIPYLRHTCDFVARLNS